MNVFVFTEGEKCGLMDEAGTTVLDAKYELLGLSHDGLVAFEENRRWGIMDFQGRVVRAPEFSSVIFMDGDAIVVKKGIYRGVLRRDGTLTCECTKYVRLGRFSEGLAPAALSFEPSYGFVDIEGEFVIEPSFESAEQFWEGRAAVKNTDGKFGFIDPEGKEKIPFKYSLVYRFSEGLAAFSKNKSADRYGFLNRDGEEVLKPQWNGAGLRFSEGLACVWKDGKNGFIDRSGDLVIEYKHPFAEDFSCGLALCGTERRGKYSLGFINAKGEWAIEKRFIEANSFEGGLAMVSTAKEDGYIDVTGKWVRCWPRE